MGFARSVADWVNLMDQGKTVEEAAAEMSRQTALLTGRGAF
jgi:ABC-type polar amino acid transport system ATPase subunit